MELSEIMRKLELDRKSMEAIMYVLRDIDKDLSDIQEALHTVEDDLK